MKKVLTYLFLLVCSFSFVLGSVKAAKADKKETTDTANTKEVETVGNKKPVLYFFRRTGCPHCIDELKYLGEKYDDLKDKIDIVVYDYYAEGNQDIVNDVAEALKVNPEEFGFPFNVIGGEQFMGYADSISDSFDEFINNGIEANETDVVAGLIEKNKYDNLHPTTLKAAMKEEGVEVSKDSKSNDAIIIGIFFGVIVIGIAGLVIYSRKQA